MWRLHTAACCPRPHWPAAGHLCCRVPAWGAHWCPALQATALSYAAAAAGLKLLICLAVQYSRLVASPPFPLPHTSLHIHILPLLLPDISQVLSICHVWSIQVYTGTYGRVALHTTGTTYHMPLLLPASDVPICLACNIIIHIHNPPK